MIKKWNEFLIKESIISIKDLKDIPKDLDRLNFGLTIYEIFDQFYDFNRKDFNLYGTIGFLDNDNNIRSVIKIGENVYPTINLKIEYRSKRKFDKDYIELIKKVINKITRILKFKSGNNFNNIYLIDPVKSHDDDIGLTSFFNLNEYKVDSKNPFDLFGQIETELIYKINNEDIEIDYIHIVLASDKLLEITPLIFYKNYDLSSNNKIDDEGNAWSYFRLKGIAEYLFDDSKEVYKYYEPEDWEILSYNDSDIIISDVLSYIDDDNKKILINYLEKSESIKIESDEELKELFESHESDILSDIINRYDSVLSDKLYESGQIYIKDSIIDYLDQTEIEYITTDGGDGEYIYIKFDPNIFIKYYSESDDPEQWEIDWSNDITNGSIDDLILDYFKDCSGDIRFNYNWSDNIYLYREDINIYIKDIFDEYGIK